MMAQLIDFWSKGARSWWKAAVIYCLNLRVMSCVEMIPFSFLRYGDDTTIQDLTPVVR
jgi:hypothetical protein